jgi:pyridinium-3,5-biscarboxylic acid mononucleotide sulfurtransferase
MNTVEKTRAVKDIIASKGSMLVAFSGGVDSTLLAVLAKEVLGNNTLCVLLDSHLVPRAAVEQAHTIAHELGLDLETIAVPHRDHHPEFRKNPANRCYYCKKFSAAYLRQRAEERGLACIADGMNISDMAEHRPGLAGSTEAGIIHPFIESGITKQEIREIAREYGLSVWQKPSAACLSSRIPYEEEITREKLRRIEEAEAFLTGQGFGQIRVRLHGTIARIEVHKEEMGKILDMQPAVVQKLKSIGFSYVTLDLEGYRSGSMDEVL